jgi:predicted HicB family RNase H-like nuclease
MASRRAYADQYALRVNRAVELLAARSPAEAVRALRAEHALSERQARRYLNAARATPGGVVVPERTVVFTVRLAPSLIAGLRARARASGQTLSATVAEAVRLYLDHAHESRGATAR